MRSLFIIGVLIALIASCNTDQSDEKTSHVDTTTFTPFSDTASVKADTRYFWSAELHPKKGLIMVRVKPINTDSLTAKNMIQMLNGLHPEIKLHLTKISNDSIFVKINNSRYLTQQIGSSGAELYLAEVTYNLTELQGVNFVKFDFKEGDHAAPGTFSRVSFVFSDKK